MKLVETLSACALIIAWLYYLHRPLLTLTIRATTIAMTHENTRITDTSPILTSSYISFSQDEEIRSPRTPTWTPLSPALTSPFDYTKYFATDVSLPTLHTIPPPPTTPLPWVWQCHLCRNRYPLGVTRRCLYDGHYYCSGETDRPNLKKKKKGLACSSEFDYEGWEDYRDWRRQALRVMENPRMMKGCDGCAFPSQCRTSVALHPPKKKKVVVVNLPKAEKRELEEIQTVSLKDVELEQQDARRRSNPEVDFESFLDPALVEITGKQNELSDVRGRQGKVQELIESLHGNVGQAERKGEKGERKRLKKRSSAGAQVSVVEDERLRQDIGHSLQDLVLPVMDFWSGGKGKQKRVD